jgi:hypothetical protein
MGSPPTFFAASLCQTHQRPPHTPCNRAAPAGHVGAHSSRRRLQASLSAREIRELNEVPHPGNYCLVQLEGYLEVAPPGDGSRAQSR